MMWNNHLLRLMHGLPRLLEPNEDSGNQCERCRLDIVQHIGFSQHINPLLKDVRAASRDGVLLASEGSRAGILLAEE